MSTRTRDVRSYVVSDPTGLSARGAQKIALFNRDGSPYSSGSNIIQAELSAPLPITITPEDPIFDIATLALDPGTYLIVFGLAGLQPADPEFLTYAFNVSSNFEDSGDPSPLFDPWPIIQMQTWSGEEEMRAVAKMTTVCVIETGIFSVSIDASDPGLLGGTVTQCNLSAIKTS